MSLNRDCRGNSRLPSLAARLRPALLGALASLLLAVAASADVLILTDGTRLEGTVRKSGENYTVTAEDGTVTTVPAEKVSSVELRGAGAARGPLDVRLESLRRSVSNLDDLGVIIGKYQDFIARNPEAEATVEAKKELEKWLDYQERGLVKYGTDWLTPAQRDLRLRDAFLEVSDARLQIKQGELDKARRILDRMLRTNPQDYSALYLAGVIEMKTANTARAREQFEKVRDLVPGHPPTLVNLAAINIEQDNHVRALTFLADAMNQEPGNREILDNVAEALELMPPKVAESRQAEEVRQLFLSQDSQLRQKMAERGLYRWGSTWVNREQLDELQAMEQQIKTRIAELSAQHDQIATAIAGLESRHEANERFMERLKANSFYRDKDGKIIRIPLPPEYYETAREQEQLLAEREELFRQMAGLEQAAAQEQARFPTPPFKGRLEPIGEDGVPVQLPPGSPSTLPGDQQPAEQEDRGDQAE